MHQAAYDIVLVSMPFNVCVMPPIGVCTLKSVLDQHDVHARVRHFNLEFLPFISSDLDSAHALHDEISYLWDFLPGEWLFSPQSGAAEDQRFLRTLQTEACVRHTLITDLATLRTRTQAYIEHCASLLAADRPKVVGFTSSFMQNQASVSLARAVKRLCPDVKILFGGSNAFGEMGRALLEQYGVIDVVVRGEAENIIVPLVRAMMNKDGEALREIPGICFHEHGSITCTADSGAPIDMDQVPVPEFSDYFSTLNALRLKHPGGRALPHYLPIETSRGCWWGERSHCTFCGLNADRMTFRSRSVDAAFEYISTIQRRYGVARLFAVDNIIDHRYYDTVLERLAESDVKYFIHYEIKSNLKRRHVNQLVRSGVQKVQPGIESLSTPILRLMRKGVTALQNIQTLRWLTESGIQTSWYLLYGFPGEDIASYRELARLIPKLSHIAPPGEIAPVYIERFSPYQTDPASFGIELTGPTQWYSFAFPEVPANLLNRLAYRFDFREPQRNPDLDRIVLGELRPKVRAWKAHFQAFGPTLHIVHGPHESAIAVGQASRPQKLIRLDGMLRSVMLEFEEVRPVHSIREDGAVPEAAEPAIVGNALYERFVRALDCLIDSRALKKDLSRSEALKLLDAKGLLLRDGGSALALPLVCNSERLERLLDTR